MNNFIIAGDGSVPEEDAPLYKVFTLTEAAGPFPAGTVFVGRLEYLFPALDNNPTPNDKANLLDDTTAALTWSPDDMPEVPTVNLALAQNRRSIISLNERKKDYSTFELLQRGLF